jgi:predicted extracellular nuclease
MEIFDRSSCSPIFGIACKFHWKSAITLGLTLFFPGTAHAALLISEYIEPTAGNNKALEIFNSGAAAFDLDDNHCTIRMYFNGSATASQNYALSGAIAAGDVFVVAPTNADDLTLLAVVDQQIGTIWFNGDDAVELSCDSETQDIVGQIGFDPGTSWGSGIISTANHTLRRKNSITAGDTNSGDTFDPTLEWVGVGDSVVFSGLGVPGEGESLPPDSVECNEGSRISIAQVQGAGAASPMVGATVIVQGTVIADFEGPTGLQGFFIQDDGDPLDSQSDGIFIYNPGASLVATRDVVAVKGEVTEYFERTEIDATAVQVCGTASLPAPVAIPVPKGAPTAGVDAWERFESMRVTPNVSVYVTEHYQLERFGQFAVSANGRLDAPTEVATPGAAAQTIADANALNYFFVEDGSNLQNVSPVPFPAPGLSPSNTLRAGTRLDGLVGPLDFAFGYFRIRPTQDPIFTNLNPRPASAPAAGGGHLRIATYNTLNFFTTLDSSSALECESCGVAIDCRGANNAAEFTRQRDKLVAGLIRLDADIIALEELENNDDSAASALVNLTDAFNAAGGSAHCSHYTPLRVGEIGCDAIALGLIYCDSTVSLAPGSSPAILDDSELPGLGLASLLPVFDGPNSNRAILAASFKEVASDQVLTLALVHLKSKGVSASFRSACESSPGDPNCDQGDGQGFWNARRVDAAHALAQWLDTDPTGVETGKRLILGDFNAYAQEDPPRVFAELGYLDLNSHYEARPSYAFDGRWGALDRALASPELIANIRGAGVDAINADEPLALDYNVEFKDPAAVSALYAPDEFRASDHSPLVVGVTMNGVAVPVGGGAALVGLGIGLLAIARPRQRVR